MSRALPPPGASFQVGPLAFHTQIGRGATSEVWRVQLAPTGSWLAAKVFVGVRGGEALRTQMTNELGAVAKLDHPHIVRVFHAGFASGPGLPASWPAEAPYVVLELGVGTLRALPVANWSAVVEVAEALLGALGHAHAYELLHRDVKPENVLRVPRPGGGWRWKLADFGLAARDGVEVGRTSGTPGFMAPELILGQLSLQRPATDLYACGCLLWELVAGTGPFQRATQEATLAAHRAGELPELRPRFPVPAGVEAWLRRLVDLNPGARYQTAADARHELRALGSAADPRSAVAVAFSPARATFVWEAEPAVEGELATFRASDTGAAPLPARWSEESDAAPWFPALGDALVQIHPAWMIGRSDVKQTLWTGLLRAQDDRRAQLRVIEGASGSGRRTLAEWLIRQAYSDGGARGTRFEARGGAASVSRKVAEILSRQGDVGAGIAKRMAEDGLDDPLFAAAVRELVAGSTAGSSAGRYRAARWLFTRRAHDSVVVLAFLDVELDPDCLWLAEAFLADEEALGVMVVVTVRAEAADPILARRVEALLAVGGERAARVILEPLAADEQLALVQRSVGADPALALAIARRGNGNPGLTHAIVESLVLSQALVPGPAGYRLAEPDTELPLPADARAAWALRAALLLGGLPLARQHAAELLAVGGLTVSESVWVAACRAADVAPGAGGIPRWDPMLVEALVEQARHAGRLPRWRQAWLDVLPRGAARARHHLELGDPNAAFVDALADLHLREVGPRSAHAAADLAERALRKMQVDKADPRWLQVALGRGQAHRRLGDLPAAAAVFEEALDGAALTADTAALLEARVELALVRSEPAARAWLERLATVAELLGSNPLRASCVVLGANLARRVEGRTAQAFQAMEGLIAGLHPEASDATRFRWLLLASRCARDAGHLDRAAAHLEAAATYAHTASAGALLGIDRAGLALEAGDLEAAFSGYQAVYTTCRDEAFAELASEVAANLAGVCVLTGAYADADRWGRAAIAAAELRGFEVPICWLAMGVAAYRMGDTPGALQRLYRAVGSPRVRPYAAAALAAVTEGAERLRWLGEAELLPAEVNGEPAIRALLHDAAGGATDEAAVRLRALAERFRRR